MGQTSHKTSHTASHQANDRVSLRSSQAAEPRGLRGTGKASTADKAAKRSRPGRYATALRIAMTSDTGLANPGTAVTSLLLTPVLQVLLLVAVTASLSGVVGSAAIGSAAIGTAATGSQAGSALGPGAGATSASLAALQLRDTAYAGIVVAFGLAVLAGAVGQVTMDRRLGVLQDVLSHGMWNPAYWMSKVAVPALLGIGPAVASAAVVFWLDGSGDSQMLVRVLVAIGLAAVTGSLVGVAASVASLVLSDPYVISNIAHAVLLITSGVVLPLSLYPGWLAWIARALPLTAVVESLRAASSSLAPWLLVQELAVGLAWLGLSMMLAGRVMSQVRTGRKTADVW